MRKSADFCMEQGALRSAVISCTYRRGVRRGFRHSSRTPTAVAWPLAGRAQQKAIRVIAFLNSASPERNEQTSRALSSAFRQGLSETGNIEGQNWTAEYRYADGDYDRLPAMAADLVARKVDV